VNAVGRDNNFTVNARRNDQSRLPAISRPDTIEEFRVLTNTFDADMAQLRRVVNW